MKKNKSNWLITVLILLFLAGLGGLFWWIYKQLKPSKGGLPITTSQLSDSEINKITDTSLINVLESKVNNLFNQTVSNSINYFETVAGEALLNNSIVAIIDNKAYLFDSTDEAHFNVQCGFVISGVAINETATVYLSGTITLIGNILDANNKYFVGNNGNLIDEIPNNYGIQSVGYAISTNQIILDFSERYSL